ncbi:DUF86 domain-containing protein [Alkalicoccus daliensis]|uniref:Uncharacterized conserved protein YutE, UPF0331/DUF86 family n=1 Tax=Alkalicoccus daliensis TaxID=745820 RepID=A0A1H0JGB2_9BACI|nr:DUF86 domain-containing protein [Alkalicoccus daliensis]SDO42391.1 Uncharacterized conserved protein YutE, UPF0331/DUF86 family [Alkalicoccus daliensis]
MYFVDRTLIEERLSYIERLLNNIEMSSDKSDCISVLAQERIFHMLIEAMMDVGNQMIDGFIMRDPGSFEDIVAILVDEKVITASEGSQLEKLLPLRKELLRNYTSYNYQELTAAYAENVKAVQSFPKRIREYLANELGPVSAFLPEQEEGKE